MSREKHAQLLGEIILLSQEAVKGTNDLSSGLRFSSTIVDPAKLRNYFMERCKQIAELPANKKNSSYVIGDLDMLMQNCSSMIVYCVRMMDLTDGIREKLESTIKELKNIDGAW
jgi:hypothetical protein